MARNTWLSAWSNENDPTNEDTRMNQVLRLIIFIGIGVMESAVFLTASSLLVSTGLNASKRLHAPLIHNLMR
ncbi:hypothetical protein PMAYCL1PPCAC_11445, partial [Pristionchus mayeri]